MYGYSLATYRAGQHANMKVRARWVQWRWCVVGNGEQWRLRC